MTMNDYKFAGLTRDPTTSLDQAKLRTYSSTINRWLTPDPMGGDITNPQSLNRYAYALNNPATLTDPLGLFTPGPGAPPPFLPVVIGQCTYDEIESGVCYGGSSPAPQPSQTSTPPPAPKPTPPAAIGPAPPPQPSPQQQFKACVAQAKAVENAQLKSAIGVTAAGGGLVLASSVVVPYVSAEEGLFEGIEGVANGIHLGPVSAFPVAVYWQGVMKIRGAVNQYDASVAQCRDKYGVYPSGG